MPPRVSVVTGGSSGLGLALARALATGGDRVILIARDTAKLDAAMSSITQHCATNTVFCKAADVAQGPAMKIVADQIAAEHGGIDLWINSAGIMREGYFENLTDSDFREVFDINLFGTINCVRAALPHIRKTKGQIVNIASMAAHTGVFGYTAYCASKHALKGFTESLYHELRPQGITVQLICPPEFESPMAAALDRGQNARERRPYPDDPARTGRSDCPRYAQGYSESSLSHHHRIECEGNGLCHPAHAWAGARDRAADDPPCAEKTRQMSASRGNVLSRFLRKTTKFLWAKESLDHLESIRRFELDFARHSFPRSGRVLEIGAGTGWQAKALQAQGLEVDAIDLGSSNYREQQGISGGGLRWPQDSLWRRYL